MTRVFRTRTAEETETIGKALASLIEPPMALALLGPLGAGKTTLVRGIARGLGIERVKSPSFTLIHRYDGRVPFYHVDLYRLESAEELVPLGLMEVLEDPSALVAVEWAERCAGFLPEDHLRVDLAHGEQEGRTLCFESFGPRSKTLLEGLSARIVDIEKNTH
jgi:tRNA threonylcarbamoyladenosine biosynthesis protein TsaE